MAMIVLLYLYFIGLMTSISLMDAMSSLVFIHLVYLILRKKVALPSLTSLGIAQFYLPWLVIIFISLLANYSSVHWGKELLDLKWFVRAPLVAWAALAIVFKDKLNSKDSDTFESRKYLRYLRYFYVPILFVSAYAIIITLLGYDPIRPHRTDLIVISELGGVRTPGFLGNPMTFAHAFGVLFCIFWAFCLYFFNELKTQISKLDLYGLGITLLLSAMAIFLSFTRGAWLSIGIGVLAITYLYKPKWGKYVILTSLVFLILTPMLVPTIRTRFVEVANARNLQLDRWHLWQANFSMFLDHPLTGVGYGENFYHLDEYFKKMNLPQDSFKSHAHNQFLQQLAGTGFFGLLIYLAFLFGIAKKALRYWKNEQEYLFKALSLGVFAMVLHIFWGGLFEANFEDSETLHMFCFFIGLFFFKTYRSDANKKNNFLVKDL